MSLLHSGFTHFYTLYSLHYHTHTHTHTHTPPQEKLYVVLDTNVLVSHLQFLIELKDYAIKGVGRPILVVPWIVMQELDSLKVTGRGREGGGEGGSGRSWCNDFP